MPVEIIDISDDDEDINWDLLLGESEQASVETTVKEEAGKKITSAGGKMVWPELLGKKGKKAKAVIQKENPYTDAAIFAPKDAIVTDDYCCNRVRIYVDCNTSCDYENAVVVQVPKVG
ncbi:inhibitor of trypsin and hageman factor-like [Phragmites australis]|uniref:inhibitor of trypsin and hageman factor-like n=1 Tax=Phragmites australis TaxID=29695 RepID=UPI002D78CD23|nr:inhibitor of trypsin and hageman factor-like [Phragmites australis]